MLKEYLCCGRRSKHAPKLAVQGGDRRHDAHGTCWLNNIHHHDCHALPLLSFYASRLLHAVYSQPSRGTLTPPAAFLLVGCFLTLASPVAAWILLLPDSTRRVLARLPDNIHSPAPPTTLQHTGTSAARLTRHGCCCCTTGRVLRAELPGPGFAHLRVSDGLCHTCVPAGGDFVRGHPGVLRGWRLPDRPSRGSAGGRS